MEYLLNELTRYRQYLTSNLFSMSCKHYIITFISVIEAIFYTEIQDRNLLPTDEWEKVSQQDMFSIVAGNCTKTSTILYKKVKPYHTDIRFEWLLKTIESKKIYGVLEHDNFAKVKWLQKLRNKVHLHLAMMPEQSDYNSFNCNDINMANEVLLNILEFYSTNDGHLLELPFNQNI